MKIRRFLSVFLILSIALLFLTACEGEKDAWTLDEALKMVGTEQAAAMNGRIPLSDDFSEYDCYSDGEYIAGSGKILILQREGPEKEYSRSSFPYPDDYRGEDKGKAKVWLRADLMNRIPEDRRASTTEEAETIIMAESYYEYTGCAVSEAESISGMNYDEYRPLFSAFNGVRLYSIENKGGLTIVSEQYRYPELCADPESVSLWMSLDYLRQMNEAMQLDTSKERFDEAVRCLEWLDFYETLPLSVRDRLFNLLMEDDAEALSRMCTNLIWSMAEEFAELDPDYADEFTQIIRKQSFEELASLVDEREYDRVTLTVSEILIRRAYMGTPDPERMTVLIDEALSFLDDVEWNMNDARRILMYGY
ncbi:MAG: hypothetical protein IJE08_14305 [Clostridia bacterium]|nr:hypothetical protein [Clostridia bacterium]